MASMREKTKLIRILRILTPLEIATMTKVSTGVKKIKLTDLMLGRESLEEEAPPTEMMEQKAEILNFPAPSIQINPPAEQSESLSPQTSSDEKRVEDRAPPQLDRSKLDLTKEEAALSAAGIASQKEIEESKRLRQEEKNKSRKSTSQFIVDQKKDLEQSCKKLLIKAIKKAYVQALNVDIELQKKTKDLSKSTNLGVLINKKQS